jgi:predicted O-methyltransferase YrrM
MKRSFRHWTPDYLWSRLKDKLHQRLHPEEPWLTPAVVHILDQHLTKEMIGLEFGSGRSTVWFARHLGKLTSIEHSPEWFKRVNNLLRNAGAHNVELFLRENSTNDDYSSAANQINNGSLDFVLVDGIDRGKCAVSSLEKLKPGGILVIDDVHRYLPSESRAPLARKPGDGAVDEDWQEFLKRTMDWEYIWTSNGVKDTVIYHKPVEE